MVALGWMNILWMGLFAGIIFGEKIWSRGIWIARAAGIGLIVIGGLAAAGMLPSIVSSATSITSEDDRVDDMMMNDNDYAKAMSKSSPEPSMDILDDNLATSGSDDQSNGFTSHNDVETMEPMVNENR